MVTDDRAQAFTLEGIVAALVLLSSIVFAIQMTAVTPLTASTSNQQIEGELERVADGLLEHSLGNGTLRPALLYWDDSVGAFHDASAKGYYTACAMPLPFGALLERTFSDHGVACNVNLQYVTVTGETRVERLVYVGTPTDHAVRATALVTLYDDEVLLDASGTANGQPLSNSSTFYAPDAAPGSRLYNVIQVEVVVWRM